MADQKRRDPLKDRISALPGAPPPPKLGIGKQPIPPPKPKTELGRAVLGAFGPPPLPRAVQVDEPTKPGGFEPAPGSVGPRRSLSPPPAELAPDPQSRREAQRAARQKVAESERQPVPGPAPAVVDSIKIELPANLRGGLGALGKAVLGALAAAAVGGGGAAIGSQSALPPAVAECPAQLEQLRAKVNRLEGRADKLEDDESEARRRWRKTDEKAEEALGKANELEKRTPRINP